jgi:macrodomain Ter protein organizer (MatP/YcbG family)
LGIILCAGKDQEHVELLEMEKSGIHVASYLTKMLPKKELERKLHQAVRLARARLAERLESEKQLLAPAVRRR